MRFLSQAEKSHFVRLTLSKQHENVTYWGNENFSITVSSTKFKYFQAFITPKRMKSLETVFGFICLKTTLGPNTSFMTRSNWLLSEDFQSSDICHSNITSILPVLILGRTERSSNLTEKSYFFISLLVLCLVWHWILWKSSFSDCLYVYVLAFI